MPKPKQEFTGWIRLSSTFWDDPDVEAMGMSHAAYFLMIACRIRQLRSDGWITEVQASKLGYPKWRAGLCRMVELGKLTAHTNAAGQASYFMPSYLKWNYSEAEFDALRNQKRTAGRKSRCVTNHGAECGCWEGAPAIP